MRGVEGIAIRICDDVWKEVREWGWVGWWRASWLAGYVGGGVGVSAMLYRGAMGVGDFEHWKAVAQVKGVKVSLRLGTEASANGC